MTSKSLWQLPSRSTRRLFCSAIHCNQVKRFLESETLNLSLRRMLETVLRQRAGRSVRYDRRLRKAEVAGSNPARSTTSARCLRKPYLFSSRMVGLPVPIPNRVQVLTTKVFRTKTRVRISREKPLHMLRNTLIELLDYGFF